MRARIGAADQQAPEGAADAVEADAGRRDEKGRQRRLALAGVGERVVQGRAEGVEQRETGDRLDEDRRAGGESGDAAGQEAENDKDEPRGRRRDPAFLRIGRGVRRGAERRGDRAQVDGVAAERRGENGEEPGRRDQRPGRRLVVIGREHRHARQVLRGHGDDEQRQRQRDDRLEREGRRDGQKAGRQVRELEARHLRR